MTAPGTPGVPATFSVRIEVRQDVASVRLAGELDLASVERLGAVADDLAAAGLRRVDLDVGDLGFVDLCGARALGALCHRLRLEGTPVDLHGIRAPVARVLRFAGLVTCDRVA